MKTRLLVLASRGELCFRLLQSGFHYIVNGDVLILPTTIPSTLWPRRARPLSSQNEWNWLWQRDSAINVSFQCLRPVVHWLNQQNRIFVFSFTFFLGCTIAIYSHTPLYGHLLHMDSSLLRTVCFVPAWDRKYLTFSLDSTRLIRHPVNMDTFYGPLSVCINGIWLYWVRDWVLLFIWN